MTQFELWVSPKGYIPVRHRHPTLSETVEVISGVFKVECDREIKYLKPGEIFTIEKGKPHQWWNESDSVDAHVIFTIEPAGKFEEMQEQIFGICNAKGKLSFLQIMVMAKEYDMIIAGPPFLFKKLCGPFFLQLEECWVIKNTILNTANRSIGYNIVAVAQLFSR